MPATRDSVLTLLQKGDWFGNLPESLQARIIEHSTLHRFSSGDLINAENHTSTGLWAVLQGQVLVSESFADGTDFLVQVGGPGYWIEFVSLLMQEPTLTRVTANTSVRAMLLPASAFRRIVEEDPAAYRYFAQPVLHRYRSTLRILAQALTMDPEDFLQARLALLISHWRGDGYEEPVIELELSQSAAARMLGLSRQTFNRYLARLEEEGIVETSFRTIRILQPDLLCARAAAL